MATTTATTLAASAGDGSSPPSRSTVMTIAAQAYHVLKINGYSNTLKAGCHYPLSSCPFSAGGHTWHVSATTQTDAATATRTASPSSSRLRASSPRIGGRAGKSYIQPARSIREPGAVEKPSVVVPPSNMHLHYGDLLVSKEGTDVKFLVGGEMFAAHRLVLAARSPVFKAELFGPTKKGTIDAIQIDNMEARVFKALLGFIYTDIWPEIGPGKDNVAMAQQLFAAADRYGLQRLKFVYEDKLCNHIDTCSVSTMLVLVEKHHCCKLKEACSTFLSSMSPPIVEDPNSSIFGSELEKTVSSS
ncbi:hypothetical protein OsI_33737 [Oryza sativa Indica Group]|uniref:BTB domain-containing protein n=1 Tax=Oryza sativa subsp. indica TaxID=39946 RepID=B8BH15_ORYSI|nr:hypothetical protein OsI_33737 [Oryza sativa Indica Group]